MHFTCLVKCCQILMSKYCQYWKLYKSVLATETQWSTWHRLPNSELKCTEPSSCRLSQKASNRSLIEDTSDSRSSSERLQYVTNMLIGTCQLFQRFAILFSLQSYAIGLELRLSAITDFKNSGPSEHRDFGIADLNYVHSLNLNNSQLHCTSQVSFTQY